MGHSLALFFSLTRTPGPACNCGFSLIVALMRTCKPLSTLWGLDHTKYVFLLCVQELVPMIYILCSTAMARWWTSSSREIVGKDFTLLLIGNLVIKKDVVDFIRLGERLAYRCVYSADLLEDFSFLSVIALVSRGPDLGWYAGFAGLESLVALHLYGINMLMRHRRRLSV